ncbi:MAG: hypothetical protein A2148_11395 [Chloroflexi bacterium RBG_16_68_14]|nr:MAG: hypothetical protein A2148_11395 [Chloroflexi bacterium RBG_16_68_14]
MPERAAAGKRLRSASPAGALAWASMPRRRTTLPTAARELLDWLDQQAEAFSGATTREYYLNYAGLKDDLALAPIFERHADLFRRETVGRALGARTKDARAPHLRQFVVDGYLEQAAKELTEEIAGRETADTVAWDGEEIPYRSVQQRLMNDPDAARRHELDQRRVEVTAAQNPLRERRWDLLYAQTRELGFASYVALCDELGALGLERLRETVERFLWETEKPYRDRLEQELRGIDVDPALAERSDLLRLFRSPQFDAAFPRERMLPALEETLRGLGVDVAHQPNVHLDAEERPRKSPRAFCAPVEIPGEIYLVISPHGGHDDYRALFHEAGHAQHFAHIRAEQPFAFRGLGDNSVTEGFAFVLEHLLYSAAWLRRCLGLEETEPYLSLARFHKLYFLRRYAAKLLYELELHAGGDVRAHGKRYADLLTAHVGVRYSPADYLSDLDDGFYCARYLRAWIFEAQLRSVFERRWGEEWFAVPEAGAALRELWSLGQRHSADELIRQLGEPGLDIAPLAAEVAVPTTSN